MIATVTNTHYLDTQPSKQDYKMSAFYPQSYFTPNWHCSLKRALMEISQETAWPLHLSSFVGSPQGPKSRRLISAHTQARKSADNNIQ